MEICIVTSMLFLILYLKGRGMMFFVRFRLLLHRQPWVVPLTSPTLTGRVIQVKIPKGTQNSEVVPIRGEGFPNVHGYGRGNLLVQVIAEVPTKMTSRQEELLREFGIGEKMSLLGKRNF